jgi:protoheme IX farnesyltransferase
MISQSSSWGRSENWMRDKVIHSILFAATLAAFFAIVLGYAVRVSGADRACPDWPTCYGQFGFPQDRLAQLQVIHRDFSALMAVLTLAAAVAVIGRFRRVLWIWIAGSLTVAMVALQTGIGAGLVFGGGLLASVSPATLDAIHLGLALLIFSFLLAATVIVPAAAPDGTGRIRAVDPALPALRLSFVTRFSRLALAAVGIVFVLMISGAILTGSGGGETCSGWPLCAGGQFAGGALWLQFTHLFLSAVAVALMTGLFFSAWRSQRNQALTLTATTAAFILFFGQVGIGMLKVARSFPPDLVWLHAASAVALWGVLTVLVISSGLSSKTALEGAAEAAEAHSFWARARDFFLLNKPVIVALLLVITYAGMVMGGRAIPSLSLTFWTMLGGALAAGGASALNQYIDREADKAMQRTAKRPLPAGRLLPAEGLAYGTGAMLAAFFILAGGVNLLSALLALAGMVYYVLLYSIWLKRLTVQNIVIGGGAGAIPPLVGWAAASGALNVPSLFLFAIVFMWTPPHFWALALVRRKDYARAGVPMLPVVKGEQVTRNQIFIYTLELVTLTLLMPVFKVAGSFFLVSAIVLGLWLISAAWKVFKQGGNKSAWKMYRYSSMYLAFLFLALVLDVFIGV